MLWANATSGGRLPTMEAADAKCTNSRRFTVRTSSIASSDAQRGFSRHQRVCRRNARFVFESDRTRIAELFESLHLRRPIDTAGARLMASGRIGNLHVPHVLHASCQDRARLLAHHHRVVEVVQDFHAWLPDLLG